MHTSATVSLPIGNHPFRPYKEPIYIGYLLKLYKVATLPATVFFKLQFFEYIPPLSNIRDSLARGIRARRTK